jgi:hypothetical protein
MSLSLLQAEGRALKISAEVLFHIEAMVHPPGAACYGWSAGARLAFDSAERILGWLLRTR